MIATARGDGELRRGTRDVRPLVVLACACVASAALLVRGREAEASLLLGALALAWAAMPLVVRLARRTRATVLPGGRSIHEAPTPLLGGLVVSLPLMGALLWRGGAQAQSLALAVGMLLLVGLIDDLRGLGATRKLMFQALAAILLFAGGHRLPGLSLAPLGLLETGAAELLLLIAWVVLVTNAVNLSDGMDGLAASLALVACAGLVVLGRGGLEVAVVAGALLGFLRFNLPLPRAHIFLGDAGTLPLGVALAALTLDSPRGLDLPIAAGLLALPLGDLFLACARRWLRGKPLFAADQGHVHHLLLRAWKRPSRVLLGLVCFASLHLAVAVMFRDLRALALEVGLWAALCAYLIARSRDCFGSMVRRRRTLQRAHLISRYSDRALDLADSREEVKGILDRMALVLDLGGLQVRDLELGSGAAPATGLLHEEIACLGGDARVSYRDAGADAILDEERRAIVCDLVRRADAVLARLPAPLQADRRPIVHFIISGRKDLRRIAPVLESSRERGAFRPILVHTGRCDVLRAKLEAAGEHLRTPPDIDLDVDLKQPEARDILVRERYAALLEAMRPSFAVVVGRTGATVACARAAWDCGLPVCSAQDLSSELWSAAGAKVEPAPSLQLLFATGSGAR